MFELRPCHPFLQLSEELKSGPDLTESADHVTVTRKEARQAIADAAARMTSANPASNIPPKPGSISGAKGQPAQLKSANYFRLGDLQKHEMYRRASIDGKDKSRSKGEKLWFFGKCVMFRKKEGNDEDKDKTAVNYARDDDTPCFACFGIKSRKSKKRRVRPFSKK
jgi:hypothetical protein